MPYRPFALLVLLVLSACTLIQAEPTPTVIPPTITAEPLLMTFQNRLNLYRFRYPTGLVVEEDAAGVVRIENQIVVEVSAINPINPATALAVGQVEAIEAVNVAGNNGWRVRGFEVPEGAAGRPRRYISVVVPHNGLYYTFTVYELIEGENAFTDEPTPPGAITQEALLVFDQVVGSLRFT